MATMHILSQDSIYGLFNGIGIYCKRLPYRKFGDYQTKIVGYDQIVFNGDTLNDVSRLLTSRRYVIKYLSQDTLYSNTLPQFTTDSILYNLHSTESFVTEIELRWYAKGYRYPILEHYTLKNEIGILQNSYTFLSYRRTKFNAWYWKWSYTLTSFWKWQYGKYKECCLKI